MAQVAKQMAAALGEDSDIEIVYFVPVNVYVFDTATLHTYITLNERYIRI